MEQKLQNPMGYKPIPKLLFSMAIPSVIANLVNALYNIVDQIFIGRGVGYLGNAATNIAFPLTTICLALGLMTGIGAASNFNLELGRKNEIKARKIAGSAITFLFIIGIILWLGVTLFLKPLVLAFGATDNILEYAMSYTKITSIGLPFFLISVGINPLIRSDGSPKYSMFAIIIGALLNTILDPIFIFIFNMGIEGAAIATVISQIVSTILILGYFTRFKTVKFTLNDFIPRIKYIAQIIKLGLSAFIFQFSNMIVQVTTNNMLKVYGQTSIYGSDIPIAVAGIVMKVNIIFTAIIIGIVQGAQPICGYNYGAKKFKRVRQAANLTFKISFIVSLICFLIFQIFPRQIIELFGDGDSNYFEFAIFYTRVFLMFSILNGIQITGSTFFPAIGKAFKGAIISFTKQLLFLLPLLVIMPTIFGLKGIAYATPVADFLSFILVVFLLYIEFKGMTKEDL